ncbi:MAG: DUF1552 domain-containing protein, partial [Acidobacteria bacterium]|nr:DUF1552 domain-containing protein [Acidobacteriota bacterium]
GTGYAMPELLRPLEKRRNDFTIFSHLDHDVNGGHRAVHSFLSGLRDQDAMAWPSRNISLDQRAAEFVGGRTRFPSIVASVGGADGDMAPQMSWTRNGINVPPITKASDLFRDLFVADDAAGRQRTAASYDVNGSILDAVRSQAASLEKSLGKLDRQKLDEYLTSVREVEKKIGTASSWLDTPKPKVDMAPPDDGPFTESLAVFFQLLTFALQTDSTRVAALEIPGVIDTQNIGLTGSYHGFSHHGKAEVLQRGLLVIEKFQMTHFATFLDRLATLTDTDGSRFLDRTMVLFGSGMGNGSSHSNKDLPILLAGGGFRHGHHKAYPQQRRVPLCNLFTTMLQRFGAEEDRFNKATGTLGDFA